MVAALTPSSSKPVTPAPPRCFEGGSNRWMLTVSMYLSVLMASFKLSHHSRAKRSIMIRNHGDQRLSSKGEGKRGSIHRFGWACTAGVGVTDSREPTTMVPIPQVDELGGGQTQQGCKRFGAGTLTFVVHHCIHFLRSHPLDIINLIGVWFHRKWGVYLVRQPRRCSEQAERVERLVFQHCSF